MCVVALALGVHPRHALVLAANRDEVHRRPAAPLARWADGSGIVAGRDLEAGGTWLGVADGGRWAVLTNVRDPQNPRPAARSRGDLVADYLRSGVEARAFAHAVGARRDDYDGFNLIVGRLGEGFVVSTRHDDVTRIHDGVYGLSNDRLDTGWPKVSRVREGMRAAVARGQVRFDDLFALLDDREIAPDERLPDTGVGVELERGLSPVRIVLDGYGTRVSTALRIDPDGRTRIAERTWRPDGTAGPMAEAEISPPATRP